MRDTDPGCQPSVLGRLAEHDQHIPRAAFEQLRRGHPPSLSDVAATVGITLDQLEPVLDRLVAVGLVEREADGTIVGARGLTLRPTVHELVLERVQLHTWCALDAIGIPAALQADATVTTRCGWCEQPLHVRVAAGRPTDQDNVVLWLPETTCDNVRQQFCPDANLFCDREHLQRWHTYTDAGVRVGRVLTPAETAQLGRAWWGTDGVMEPGPTTVRADPNSPRHSPR